MIVSEYHHFSISNELVDLDIENQRLLIITQSEVMSYRSLNIQHLAKGLKPKRDGASGPSFQSTGNTEVRGTQEMTCTYSHKRQAAQALQLINFKEKKGMRGAID